MVKAGLVLFAISLNFLNVFCLKQNSLVFLKSSDEQCPANITVHGLILARKGSKGIPNKNLVTVDETSILGRAIRTMILFRKFSSVWVSTDGENIAKEAKKFAASVHWRKDETATDHATSLIAVQEFLIGHPEVETLALVQCTSPFVRTEYLNEAYQLMQQGFDTVFSATREFKLRWTKNPAGEIVPLNFNPSHRPRRQDWSGELVENGMFYFTRRKFVMKGLLQAGRIGVVEIPKYFNLEIDNVEDLKLARAISDTPLVEITKLYQ